MDGRSSLFVGMALVLTLGLGVGTRVLHTATIPNVGLPASNSKNLEAAGAYAAQVEVTRQYLLALTSVKYAAAYELLAPSTRANLNEADFEAARRREGNLGQPTVWADDETSTRAEYVLGRGDGSSEDGRHRFVLKREDGRWWLDHEAPIPPAPVAAASLTSAMTNFVQQRAGQIWTSTIELLRQEGFEDGQLLIFSYIEPRPAGVLTAERVAVLTYYVNGPDGWQRQGGGNTGLVAGMSLADVAMGFTTFGPDQRYTAYYGVIENSNAYTLTFEEPNGARHTENLKGQPTVLLVNERNPFEAPPLNRPFVSLQVKDVHNNSMRTNPDLSVS